MVRKMVVEYVRYEIAPEDAEQFMQAYRAAARDLDASPHCLGYEMSRGVEEPGNFTIRILWDSVEGHEKGFRRSDAFTRFLPKVRPYFTAIREMKHYAVFEAKEPSGEGQEGGEEEVVRERGPLGSYSPS